MKILALDTSGDACSVALYDAAAHRLLAEKHTLIERGHAELLFSQIEQVTGVADVSLKSVDRFAVTTGPGTFTGVRIGLSAARGLALAARKPLIGVGSLEAVAHGALAPEGNPIVAALDARRGEIYFQAFKNGEPILDPIAATPRDAAVILARQAKSAQLLVIGTGASELHAALVSLGQSAEIAAGETLPRASVVARMAASRAPAEKPVMPLYLRAPDAKLPAGA